MKFYLNFLAVVLCLTSAVEAVKNNTREFHLKTRLVKPRWDRYDYDNLYIYSYHTGAGLSDACLNSTKIPNGNGIAFLNVTSTRKTGNVVFQLSDEFPWGITLEYDAYYVQWSSVTINGGPGDSTFFFNRSGLVSKNEQWGGWMVCDWSHGVPQLFWRFNYATNLPGSCGIVELHPEYI